MKNKLSQLLGWVNGTSVHDSDRNQCVPDFSCCVAGEMRCNATKEAKAKYLELYGNNDEYGMMKMRQFWIQGINNTKFIIFDGDSDAIH